jgi:hypothetical protein
MSVQVFARLADGFLGGSGRIPAPRIKGGKLSDSIGSRLGCFCATTGGVEDLANVARIPAINIGNRKLSR